MAKNSPQTARNDRTAEYDAYSPDGAKIIATLEILLGEKAVRYFEREDDGSYIHEWGDDYRDYDPETVELGGQVIYVDTARGMWTEPSLTYRLRGTNRIIRRGRADEPVALPDLAFALTLGHRAEVLIRDVVSSEASVPAWPTIKASAQLDAVREAALLHGFISRMGLELAFAAFATKECPMSDRCVDNAPAITAVPA